MHIGNATNFLRIEGCRIEASALSSGRCFTAIHEAVLFDSSDETKGLFADFSELILPDVRIKLSEGGWLHFSRDHTGAVILSYRIAGWKADAAMEGKAYVEGEFTSAFYAEFRSLLASGESIKL